MEHDHLADHAWLGQFLDGCSELDRDVERLLSQAWAVHSRRQLIAMAFCKAALEHAVSQRLLLSSGQHGTALALIRLHFEATIRAAWVLFGAKDHWIQEFVEPVPYGSLSEPTMGPPIPAMLDAIHGRAPDLATEGRRLNETVKVMHSFVHGGAHLVVHALRGYPIDKLIDVLRNRNLLLLMISNVIVVASEKLDLGGEVARLLRSHKDILPAKA